MTNPTSAARCWAPRRRTLLLGSAAALALPYAQAQGASKFPTKPLRVVAPSPAGSLADVIGRVFSTRMGEQLQQPVVIDNRAGAGGSLAADNIAKSAPDGYNLLLATDSLLTINPFIYPTLAYDPRKDFQPISLLGKASVIMVANPKLGARTLADLIRIARNDPGGVNYGSGGIGHTTHLAMELFLNRAGLKMTHVAYRGTAPAMQGLLGDESSVVITGLAEALPHVKAGKLVALATSGPLGKSLFPDLPELKEVHPDLDLAFWFALLAPAHTPADVVNILNAAVAHAAQGAEVKQKLGDYGFTVMSSTPAAVSAMIAADLAKYGPLVKALGIKVE